MECSCCAAAWPIGGVVIARGVVTSVAQFFKLAIDDAIPLGFHPLVRIAHRRDVVREVAHPSTR